MIKKIVCTLLILTFTLFFRVPLKADSGVEGLITEFKTGTKCSNVSVVVYDHGNLTYYGDREGLYQIGSMTKAFTGLAIQKLINDGLISEDDKVSSLVPGFKAYYRSSEVEITVDDLLMQRSGYTNNENDYPSAAEGMTLGEWAKTVSGKELSSLPGTEYAYSNVNYNLLGMIIENITGSAYREYMVHAVLGPLNLVSTSAGMPEDTERIIEGTRLGFRNVFEYEVPVREGSIPAGYFYSDTEDIGKWMKAWIEGEDLDMEYVKGKLVNEGDYYAGWECFGDGIIGHSGGTPNYSSRIVFSERTGTGVCVLTNLNVASTTDSLCNSIFASVNGKESGGLICDVWTVFDIIFTLVSVTGAALFVMALVIRKKGLLIGTGSVLALTVILILILFPVIFGAGLKAIALIWAPWSFLAGLSILMIDVLTIVIRLIWVNVNEGRAKTG